MRRLASALFLVLALCGCESSTTIVQLSGAMQDSLFLGSAGGDGSVPPPPAITPYSTAPARATSPTVESGA